MRKITLVRLTSFADGTFGVLLDGDVPFAVTLEREWLGNQHNISCIPTGTYRCVRLMHAKKGLVWALANVPGRSGILMHKGAIEDDSKGCVLVGEQFESLKGKTAILQSGKGLDELTQRLTGENAFDLMIVSPFQEMQVG